MSTEKKWVSNEEASRGPWGKELTESEYPGHDFLKMGFLSRIAKSLEAIAAPFVPIQEKIDQAKQDKEEMRSWYRTEARKIDGLRVKVKQLRESNKKLKAQLAAAKQADAQADTAVSEGAVRS